MPKTIKPIKIGPKEALEIQRSFDCLSKCEGDNYLHNILALALDRAFKKGVSLQTPGRCPACICCAALDRATWLDDATMDHGSDLESKKQVAFIVRSPAKLVKALDDYVKGYSQFKSRNQLINAILFQSMRDTWFRI